MDKNVNPVARGSVFNRATPFSFLIEPFLKTRFINFRGENFSILFSFFYEQIHKEEKIFVTL